MSDRKWHWTWRNDWPQWWTMAEYNWVEVHFASVYLEYAPYLGKGSWEFNCVVLGFGFNVETYRADARDAALAPIYAMRDAACREAPMTPLTETEVEG